MSYSRRFRFMDGKSSLHRVEFAREFETHLAGADEGGDPRGARRAADSPVEADGDTGVAQRATPVIGAEPAQPVREAGPAREGADAQPEQGVDLDTAMARSVAKPRNTRRPLL